MSLIDNITNQALQLSPLNIAGFQVDNLLQSIIVIADGIEDWDNMLGASSKSSKSSTILNAHDLITQLVMNQTSTAKHEDSALLEKVRREAAHRIMRLQKQSARVANCLYGRLLESIAKTSLKAQIEIYLLYFRICFNRLIKESFQPKKTACTCVRACVYPPRRRLPKQNCT